MHRQNQQPTFVSDAQDSIFISVVFNPYIHIYIYTQILCIYLIPLPNSAIFLGFFCVTDINLPKTRVQ
jgi:hypothetical protein